MLQLPLLTDALLTGRDDAFIDHASLERPVHSALVPAWHALVEAAREVGFEPAIASGFRSYQRQLQIWNDKAAGRRAVLDASGQPLAVGGLDEWQRVCAILRWSALPGASRHHWGTDIDVFDRAAVGPDYVVQLTPEEAADDGPFGPFHRWLDARMASDEAFGFFRPYAADRGGIAPERWHLSFAPMASWYQRHLGSERLLAALDTDTLALRDCVRAHWREIFERFVWIGAEFYPLAFQVRVLVPARVTG
jgi:LAS superfamily LD-carboxypeptidase LdcB